MKLYRFCLRFPLRLPALIAVAVLAMSSPLAAIVVGQVDDFQGGGSQNWSGASPENIPDAGPNGTGDNALFATASGNIFGAGGKLLIFNTGFQWDGNWTAEGVAQVGLDVRNPNTFDLSMRLGIAGPGGVFGEGSGDAYVTTDALSVPADDAWHSIVFDVLADDFTLLSGNNINAALANVTHFRILHNPNVSFLGAAVDADFYVDNIRAIGATASLAGDYNGNGEVDAADYVLWRKLDGQSGAGLAADGTGPSGVPDGMVDSLDYDFWRERFGNTQSGSGQQLAAGASLVTVPEPATVLLCSAGLFALAAAYRRISRGKGAC